MVKLALIFDFLIFSLGWESACHKVTILPFRLLCMPLRSVLSSLISWRKAFSVCPGCPVGFRSSSNICSLWVSSLLFQSNLPPWSRWFMTLVTFSSWSALTDSCSLLLRMPVLSCWFPASPDILRLTSLPFPSYSWRLLVLCLDTGLASLLSHKVALCIAHYYWEVNTPSSVDVSSDPCHFCRSYQSTESTFNTCLSILGGLS